MPEDTGTGVIFKLPTPILSIDFVGNAPINKGVIYPFTFLFVKNGLDDGQADLCHPSSGKPLALLAENSPFSISTIKPTTFRPALILLISSSFVFTGHIQDTYYHLVGQSKCTPRTKPCATTCLTISFQTFKPESWHIFLALNFCFNSLPNRSVFAHALIASISNLHLSLMSESELHILAGVNENGTFCVFVNRLPR